MHARGRETLRRSFLALRCFPPVMLSFAFAGFLQERDYSFAGGEVHDGFSWAGWRNRTGAVLAALFPPARQEE